MNENEWVSRGPVEELKEMSGDFQIVFTPDGQAYHRWDGPWSSTEKWQRLTQELLDQNQDCVAIKIVINI
ncbi:MAG: hypothetical protein KA314_30175 [Chloroflexi bacterium]|nr:hypothetical protein [Chloroflexota bacterium]MBP8060127.1 hypothetical protein [Chloroflexota bacterium]